MEIKIPNGTGTDKMGTGARFSASARRSGFYFFSEVSSFIVFGAGVAVLIGWAMDIAVLKSVFPGLVTMKANTALCFALTGISLWLLQEKRTGSRTRTPANICAILVTLIGTLALGEYIFNWNLGMDQLLFKDAPGAIATFSPGRMAPTTALNFFLAGMALLLLDVGKAGRFRPSEFLIVIEGGISFLVCVGYMYNIPAFYIFTPYTGMALHTAVAFIFVFAGILFARTDGEIMTLLLSNTAGGTLLRRLSPAIMFILISLEWLRLLGERKGVFHDTEFGVALFVTVSVLISEGVIFLISKLVYRIDVAQKRFQEEVKSVSRFPAENPYPVLRVSADGVVLYFNNACSSFMCNLPCEVDQRLSAPLSAIVTDAYKTGSIKSNVELQCGERMLSFTLVPIKDTGYVNLYGTDITERKEIEKKLKEALKVKSEFTSMVSHELRTPLTAIKEGIGIVSDGTAGVLTREQKGFLDIAKRNVDRLARLINDILDFQKLEAGVIVFDMRENSVNDAVREAQKTMSALAEEKKIKFTVELDEGLPKFKFDKDKIIQVLYNLLSNAIKFTETGAITIKTRREGNTARVSIEDTGLGIKEEDLPRLFQKFSQLENGLDRKTGGSGLGLAISKEIIERHRGKVWVESKPGKGSVFNFVLPIAERRG